MSRFFARNILLCLIPLIAAAAPQDEGAEDVEQTIKVDRRMLKDGAVFFGDNPFDYPVTVRLDFPTLVNLRSNKPLPHVQTLPPSSKNVVMLRLKKIDPKEKLDWKSDVESANGDFDAEHDDNYAYTLPFPPGYAYLMHQGFNGKLSHRGKNAVDFNIPEGELVCAARAGTVVKAVKHFSEGGFHAKFKDAANTIWILHVDGTIAQYSHFVQDGVDVSVGDQVEVGDVIGRSGTTGYSKGPHLHFEVFTVNAETLETEYVPIEFKTDSDKKVLLEEGAVYQRAYLDQKPGERRRPVNAVQIAFLSVAQEIPDVAPDEWKTTFADDEVVFVHLWLPRPSAGVRTDITRAGKTDPLISRNEPQFEKWARSQTAFNLSQLKDLRGDLVARVFIGDDEVATLPFTVE